MSVESRVESDRLEVIPDGKSRPVATFSCRLVVRTSSEQRLNQFRCSGGFSPMGNPFSQRDLAGVPGPR